MKAAQLDERRERAEHNQSNESRDGAPVPRNSQLRELARRGIQMTVVSQLFPVAADDERGLARIRRDEIAGSHRARQVTRFGQVLAILANGAVHGVTAGSGCSPRSNRAMRCLESERVFGIDAADFRPRDVNRAQHIAQAHAGRSDANVRAPEHRPREQAEQSEDGRDLQGIQPSALKSRDYKSCSKGSNDDDGKYAPESRVQGEVWRHGTMFPRAHRIQGEGRNS